ncbi:hypothetical protein STAFG_0501 [Streptomyces afghaniensis 772]|uniref:Uncharacterized protein n=1 Tax=Streptomyces afghaniensis 772 TaxID=1283301 RepID=S4N176_9ACTN|nr:hypothetical protein STAFG_0501 [Streptomyces afghaniensis 772]
MEPTESAVPGSRLRLRRMAVVWRAVRGTGRPAGRPGAKVRAVGQYTADGRTPGGRAAADGRGGAQPVTEHTSGLTGADADPERHLSWPALPAAVVAAAGFVLGAGFYRAFTGGHALFPSGTPAGRWPC